MTLGGGGSEKSPLDQSMLPWLDSQCRCRCAAKSVRHWARAAVRSDISLLGFSSCSCLRVCPSRTTFLRCVELPFTESGPAGEPLSRLSRASGKVSSPRALFPRDQTLAYYLPPAPASCQSGHRKGNLSLEEGGDGSTPDVEDSFADMHELVLRNASYPHSHLWLRDGHDQHRGTRSEKEQCRTARKEWTEAKMEPNGDRMVCCTLL